MADILLIKRVVLNGDICDILIEDGIFKSIEREIPITESVTEVIEAKGRAILPSFYNLHTHVPMSLLRGYADDLPLDRWLTEHVWPLEHKFTARDYYVGTKLSLLEMIKSGMTYFCDMYMGTEHIFKATQEMGLRATIASAFFDMGDKVLLDKSKRSIESYVDRFGSKSNLIDIGVGPHAIYTVSDSGLDWISEFSKSNDLKVTIHMSETEKELNDSLKKNGCSPVAHLKSRGLLNERLIAAHGIWLDDNDIDMIADSGAVVAHCPASNMKLASGRFQYAKLQERGVKFAIATDGSCSNNNLSMMDEMKLASLRAKEFAGSPEVASAEEVYRKTTRDAALYAGIDGGEIAVGRCADAIIVNTDHLLLTPNHNIISNMVNSADTSVIDYTICNGKVLMREGVVEGEADIIQEAKETISSLLKR